MDKYEEAIKLIKDFALVDGASCSDIELTNAIDTLEELHHQYQHRLIDAQVLNDLRVITNTMGDLDLKSEVRRLVNYEIENEIKKSDKDIFCANRLRSKNDK